MECEKVQTASKSEQVSINPNFKFGGKENQLAQFGPGILSSSDHLWPNRRDHMVQNGGRRVERRRGRGPPVFLNLRFSQNHVGAHSHSGAHTWPTPPVSASLSPRWGSEICINNSNGPIVKAPCVITDGLGKYSEDILTWNLNSRSLQWGKSIRTLSATNDISNTGELRMLLLVTPGGYIHLQELLDSNTQIQAEILLYPLFSLC